MRLIAVLVLLTFAAAFTTYALLTVDRRSDEAQIRSLIRSGSTAVARRNLTGVMNCISANYKDPAYSSRERLRVAVVQALQTDKDYGVRTTLSSLEATGDVARVTLSVEVISTADNSSLYNRDLTVLLHKENARHALIVPVKVWRITSFANLGLDTLLD